LKCNNSYLKRSSILLYLISSIIISIFISAHSLTIAQDTNRIEELTRKLENLNRQIEGCGDDVGCIQSKMGQIQQLTNEIQSLKKDLQKDPEKITDELVNTLPKESEFPLPFDTISKMWLKHSIATSVIWKFDCNVISDTREKTLDKIDEIYKKGKGLTGPAWPLPMAHCEKTTATIKERGILNEPEDHYLVYELEFTDDAVWIANYFLLIGDKHIGYKDNHSYKLGLARPHKRSSRILSSTGWIMDHSKDPPVQLPLNRYKILEQEIIDIGVQYPSYKGYTMIFPSYISEDPNDIHKIGVVKEYILVLPYQIVRFYPASKPDLFIDTYVDFIPDTFSPEDIQKFFQQGKFAKIYSSGGITQEIEIGFPPLGCDEQSSSSKGAIILSGDCIDHGGYVIASEKVTTTVNSKPVARIGDKVLCFKHGETEIIASGNNNVLNEKKQIARIGDKTKCGAKLLGGSHDTFAGDK
jgi:uncharacterized Zn-binding protein involved in type VI secretion